MEFCAWSPVYAPSIWYSVYSTHYVLLISVSRKVKAVKRRQLKSRVAQLTEEAGETTLDCKVILRKRSERRGHRLRYVQSDESHFELAIERIDQVHCDLKSPVHGRSSGDGRDPSDRAGLLVIHGAILRPSKQFHRRLE
jgi:hypothetical protein